jgi:hypothetical protein
MAWIREKRNDENEVHLLIGRDERILDASPDVQPASLARSGATIYWLHDGKPRHRRVSLLRPPE